MNKVTVEMPYVGGVLSCNHYKYKGGMYTRREVKDWMEALGWQIKSAHIEDWKRPISVTCDGLFKDKNNQPDLSNLSKVILDAIEEVTGVNDRDMRWHDGTVSYGDTPTLTITIVEDKVNLNKNQRLRLKYRELG